MTRDVFLNELRQALKNLGEEEITSVISYYSEMIDDRMEAGMNEEDAVNAMEPVETIASRVLSEAGSAEETEEEKNDPRKEICKCAENVRELVVSAREQRVHVTSGDTDEIVLRYRIEDGDIYQLHEENGVLMLEHTHRPVSSYKLDPKQLTVDNFFDEIGKFIGSINLGSVLKINGIGGETRCIEVLVPRAFKGKICIQSSNARVTANDVSCMEKVKLHTSNARIVVENVVVHKLYAGTSNARVVLEDVYVREQLNVVTSNGRIAAQKTICDGEMHLRTSNASVKVEDTDAKSMTIKTSNASVSGTLRGTAADYAIESSTSNGKSNLENGGCGEKQLTVKTSNGSITMEFIG